MTPGRTLTCKRCGVLFPEPPAVGGFRRKYCTPACLREAEKARVAATYPPEDEIRRLYEVDGLADRTIARIYGRSYTWVFRVRKHYGIKSRGRNGWEDRPHHTPGPRLSRGRWGCKAKGELTCRNCGAPAQHLHHIVPRSRSRAGRDDMERNGMALCFRCHRGFHDRRITIYRDRLRPQELAFAIADAGPVWVENTYPFMPDEQLRRIACIAKGLDPDEHQHEFCEEGHRGPVAFAMGSCERAKKLLEQERADYDPPPRT